MGDDMLNFLSSFGEWRSDDEDGGSVRAASREWRDRCTALCDCMQEVEVESFQVAARATEGLVANLAGIHGRMTVVEASSLTQSFCFRSPPHPHQNQKKKIND